MGQPVTKVVNPHTGTVITVSADEDEEAINSVLEYDSAAEEIHAPRSVCAEEGPASLGAADLPDEPESWALSRELTEICAEMRAANEPAIDSVPDENIRELQERRALCAEMAATTVTATMSIDYEREEAFRDVPTSLSLCAEPGEIPSSPMTQAKETALWCNKGRFAIDRRAEDYRSEAHERHFAKAKYVVSYDDNSVTLMENKTMRGDRSIVILQSSIHEKIKKSIARKVVDTEKTSCTQRHSIEQRATRAEKYVVKEDEDSVVIEDAQCVDSTMSVSARKEDNDVNKKKLENARDKYEATHKNDEWKSRASPREFIGKTLEDKEITTASIVDVIAKIGDPVTPLSDVEKARLPPRRYDEDEDEDDDELPPLDPPPLDDSIEYHMVEPCNLGRDAASMSTQSDDDIEHIHASEVMQMRMKIDAGGERCRNTGVTISAVAQFSPITRRKSSKSTISDDDLEYIHSVELGLESLERGDASAIKSLTKASSDGCSYRRHSRHALSSDDDLEHVQLSEVRELELDAVARLSQREFLLQTTQETTLAEQQGAKSRSSRRRKDVMVIELSEAEAAEVTVLYNPLEEVWSKSEESDRCGSIDCFRDKPTEDAYPNSTRRAKNRGPKTTSFSSSSLLPVAKRTSPTTDSDIVEIIDIDAMQVDVDANATLECKILPIVASGARARKSRRSKRSQLDGQSQENSLMELSLPAHLSFRSSKVKMAELQEAVQEAAREEEPFADLGLKDQELRASPLAEISWSSIVKKSISPSSDLQEVRKETDLEPLIEVEERPEAGEHARKLEEAEHRDGNDLTFPKSARRASRRRDCRTREEGEENELLLSEKDNVDVTKTATTTVEESILVDLQAPIVDEEPRADKDIARVTTTIARTKISRDNKGNNKATGGSLLLASEVRSAVDEIRRGNVAAERRESQRESSLQLQPMTRQRAEEGGVIIRASTERYNSASSKVSPESSDHGPAEKRSETEREAPSTEHSSIVAKKASNRSKRKKRR